MTGEYTLKVNTMGIPWTEAKKVQVSMSINMGDGTYKIFEGIIPHSPNKIPCQLLTDRCDHMGEPCEECAKEAD